MLSTHIHDFIYKLILFIFLIGEENHTDGELRAQKSPRGEGCLELIIKLEGVFIEIYERYFYIFVARHR